MLRTVNFCNVVTMIYVFHREAVPHSVPHLDAGTLSARARTDTTRARRLGARPAVARVANDAGKLLDRVNGRLRLAPIALVDDEWPVVVGGLAPAQPFQHTAAEPGHCIPRGRDRVPDPASHPANRSSATEPIDTYPGGIFLH